MRVYISWQKVWDILWTNEFEHIDSDISMTKLIKLIRKAKGQYDVRNNKLIFIEYYDLMDYKWSTSVIGSDQQKYLVEKKEKLIYKIEEEKEVLIWLLDRVNEKFCGYDEIYLKVFFDRYFHDNCITKVKNRYNLNNRSYYEIMETAEYLFKRACCLLKPPQELLELIED